MHWIVISSHESNYPNPIKFKVGDVVEVGKSDDEFPGWVWVTTSDGNQGWAPNQYLKMKVSGRNAIAIQPYSAQELNTTLEEVLKLHLELNGWSWVENGENRFGWVPLDSIQPIP